GRNVACGKLGITETFRHPAVLRGALSSLPKLLFGFGVFALAQKKVAQADISFRVRGIGPHRFAKISVGGAEVASFHLLLRIKHPRKVLSSRPTEKIRPHLSRNIEQRLTEEIPQLGPLRRDRELGC